MVNPFICGSGSFHHEIEEDDEPGSPCSTTPRKQRKSSVCRSKDSKNNNPYADRGLDKFSALLAELQDKRQKIYTEVGSEEISFVRFSYSNSNDCKPIVVRVRNNVDKDKDNKPMTHNNSEVDQSSSPNEVQQSRNELGDQKKTTKEEKKKRRYSWELRMEMWRRPSYYLPAVIILILVFLAVFGRSFAILCTSIGWYIIPSIKGASSTSKRPRNKKKEYGRRASEKKIVSDGGSSSPKSVITGAMNDLSPPRPRSHRKSSW